MSVYLGDKEVGISVVAFREETDPTVPQHVKDITEQDIANWNSGGDISGIQQQINDLEQNKASILYVDSVAKSLAGQNEYIGSYSSIDYTEDTIQTALSYFVEQNTTPSREPRTGDIVNVVNGMYAGQQWIYNGIEWKYYIDFENHSVIDNLESDSVLDGLAARQGKQLKTEIDEINTNLADNYVNNTDYATSSKAGVIKQGSGFYMSDGVLQLNSTLPTWTQDYLKQLMEGTSRVAVMAYAVPKLTKLALINPDSSPVEGVKANWTEEEKQQARITLGIDTLVGDINTTLETILGV